MLTRLFQARVEKSDDNKLRFKITDESKDRHGTVIKMDGWDFSAFENNPIIFYQHLSFTSNPDHALGTGTLFKGTDGIYMEPNLEPEDINPLAHKISKKIEFGTLSMVSVGFNPTSYSFGESARGEDPDTLYFRSQELLEVSIVHIGSNRNAHNKDTQDFLDQESIAEFARKAKAELQTPPKQEEQVEAKSLNPDVTEYLRLRVM